MMRRIPIVWLHLVCLLLRFHQSLANPLFGGNDVESQQGGWVKCLLCEWRVDVALWKFRDADGNYPGLVQYATDLCIKREIALESVCRGMIKAMENEVLYVLSKLHLGGSDVCGMVLPSQCPSPTLPWFTNKWTVHLLSPAPALDVPHQITRPVAGPNYTLHVLHMSDIHADLSYSPGAVVDCAEPLCCRGQAQVRKRKRAGYWGSHGKCDIPYWTVDNALKQASEENYDYVIWTGDLSAHDDWDQSRESQIFLLHNLTALFATRFPNIRIYPALGNHESYPVNSFPPRYLQDDVNSITWLYDELFKAWSLWLPADALDTVRRFGYYTVLVRPGLRIVSLNTNACNNLNFWLLIDPRDPDSQLDWFVHQLDAAERDGEKVHVIGHISPSSDDCLPIWRDNYYAIVSRYRNVITGQFFGHEHTDEVEIQFDKSGRPMAHAFISPSLTTYVGCDPAFRSYRVASNTWKVSEARTHVMNLMEANANGRYGQPNWSVLYSAPKIYNMTDLSTGSWYKLLSGWLADEPHEDGLVTFRRYHSNYYKGRPPKECKSKHCRQEFLCSVAIGKSKPNCL